MLQHNKAYQAHWAHAAVVGLHTICCGLPAAAMAAAALSGAASGIALFPGLFAEIHSFLHAHELWILLVSAGLVGLGAGLELKARRGHARNGFPWLFGFSVFCFLVNAGTILLHQAI